MQHCGNSSANALELPQPYTMPSNISSVYSLCPWSIPQLQPQTSWGHLQRWSPHLAACWRRSYCRWSAHCVWRGVNNIHVLSYHNDEWSHFTDDISIKIQMEMEISICSHPILMNDSPLPLGSYKSRRGLLFFHTQLWFPASDRAFRWFESDFRCFCEVITGKNIVEEIESIMGAHTERSSPSWVCIPQKSLAIARDFWNTNSLRWTSFHTGTNNGFSMIYAISMLRNHRNTNIV